MAERDRILPAIEAIHRAGANAKLWPEALVAIARAAGGHAATLETINKATLRHLDFHFTGLPTVEQIEYVDHYVTVNPRVPLVKHQKAGDLGWDYLIFDEAGMNRSPFYNEFNPRMGIRYFLSGMIAADERKFTVAVVHRSRKQGHVDRADMAAMQHLLPHLQQAVDVAWRLQGAERYAQTLERALDWLTDGAVLLRDDGKLVYANAAFQAILQRADGVSIVKGTVDFASQSARTQFRAALGAIEQLGAGRPEAPMAADFPAARSTDAPPYVISLRPLVDTQVRAQSHDAVAIMFVRDPLDSNAAAARMLRDMFGLTEAEANLALALQAGISPSEYARNNSISLNTAYTHLRRIKDKTGCTRIARLNRLLNELQVPARLG